MRGFLAVLLLFLAGCAATVSVSNVRNAAFVCPVDARGTPITPPASQNTSPPTLATGSVTIVTGSLTLATDHSGYLACEPIQVRVVSHLSRPIYIIQGAGCPFFRLEQQQHGAWRDVTVCSPVGGRGDAPTSGMGLGYYLQPGLMFTGAIQDDHVAPGSYRVVMDYQLYQLPSYQGTLKHTLLSAPLRFCAAMPCA